MRQRRRRAGRGRASVTGGRGADVAFEVVGHGDTVANAIRSLRKGGTVVLIGNLSPTVELPLQSVVTPRDRRARVLRVERRDPRVHRPAGARRGGRRPIISLKAPLDDGPALFERLYSGDPALMKVIIQP